MAFERESAPSRRKSWLWEGKALLRGERVGFGKGKCFFKGKELALGRESAPSRRKGWLWEGKVLLQGERVGFGKGKRSFKTIGLVFA
ncbi:MAG: hypothetical protein HUJ69_07745 [Lachnospiraceae bacterium]|nr:hypothetical protein [Lachnospiraceae bacterium]